MRLSNRDFQYGPCGSAELSKAPFTDRSACWTHPNICGVQGASWRRLDCKIIKHSVHLVPFSALHLPACFCKRDTNVSFTFPPHQPALPLSSLALWSSVSVFKGNNRSFSCTPSNQTDKKLFIRLFLMG